MQHSICRLPAGEARRRRTTYRLPTSALRGRIPDTLLDSCVHDTVYIELIGLLPGEFINLQNGFHFRVLRGAVELNGHVYASHKAGYQKVSIPPWTPPERMLALCTDAPSEGNTHTPLNHTKQSYCDKCAQIITQNVLGGSCCDFRTQLAEDDALMKKHFNIENPRIRDTANTKDADSAALEFYDTQGPLKDARATVVAFVQHTSAFGTIDIRRIFACGKRPKVIAPQLRHVSSTLLDVCAKGELPPVLMVHGDKSAGKSTAVMHIINYLLNHVGTVALLDTDVGQPIFGPPAAVTLKFVTEPITTPPHSLAAEHRPEVICLTGEVKVTNPAMMLSHVMKLHDIYSKCVEDDRSIPLIVNTFGWVLGMGAKLLDCIAAITKASIILRLNTKHLNGVTLPQIGTHQELKSVIKDKMTIDTDATVTDSKPEVMPIFESIMESRGVKLSWDRSKCATVELPAHSQVMTLINGALDSFGNNRANGEECSLKAWLQFQIKRNVVDPSPGDLRWLRACVLLNPAFGDAMHFPQLQQEEFFGAVESIGFSTFIRNRKIFQRPKQLSLMAEKCSFVLQITTPVKQIDEVPPVIAGSMVALCSGKCELQLSNEVAPDWTFIGFVYVHYLNAEDMTMLISHSVNDDPADLQQANIVVVCQSVGFDTIPTRLCNFVTYPSLETNSNQQEALSRPREVSTTQFVPFRRNNLLHMINVQGAGNSAGNSRTNIKRHKQDLKHT